MAKKKTAELRARVELPLRDKVLEEVEADPDGTISMVVRKALRFYFDRPKTKAA